MKHHSVNPLQTGSFRIVAALLPGLLLGAVVMMFAGPISQPLSYHQFADQRTVLGIPHAGDVLSNMVFIVVGTGGLWFLSKPQLSVRSFIDHRERRPF